MSDEDFIDVEKLIASKNPKTLKRTPRFVISYLKYILHQAEINAFIADHAHIKNAEWCQAVVDYFDITINVRHIERIPKDGKIVLAMNHPLGGMDAMILVSALKDHRKDLKFIVNDLLMNLDPMKEMFVGVDKINKNRASVREQIKELFQSDEAVCIFPAGLVSRKQKGEVKDLVWKKTFVTYSKEFNRTIVPIYIDGRLSRFFYGLSNIRGKLGIKTNIEMLYLANELFKQRDRHFEFVVGEPIPATELDPSVEDTELAQQIKEKVYDLRKELNNG
ncbi:MAG: 1-acyl-sn-glycerol-3-phosphate acyltransferase [bacterium]|nr:1-acyl-sn-glycerol-3-phosphate acyltransferase [bacterium]